jgi:arrestin-related trafficking adapter 3/6
VKIHHFQILVEETQVLVHPSQNPSVTVQLERIQTRYLHLPDLFHHTRPFSYVTPTSNGSVVYKLVHRPGTFHPKLTASRVVTVISCHEEDDMDDHKSLAVERTWENQMQYLISVSDKMFQLGGVILIDITFVPVAKFKIHRITIYIEERVDYYVEMKRVDKSDPVNRVDLLSLRSHQRDCPPILPYSQTPWTRLEILLFIPFFPFHRRGRLSQRHPRLPLDPSKVASTLMGPGPWSVRAALRLP